jgi:hypothetical protein
MNSNVLIATGVPALGLAAAFRWSRRLRRTVRTGRR